MPKATFLLLPLLVVGCGGAAQQAVRWGNFIPAGQQEWARLMPPLVLPDQGTVTTEPASARLSFPPGTATVVSVQLDSLGRTDTALVTDVQSALRLSYGGAAPAHARFRQEWMIENQTRTVAGQTEHCAYLLVAGLTPDHSPHFSRTAVGPGPGPRPCVELEGERGANGMFRRSPLELNRWNTVYIGAVAAADGHSA